MAVGLVIRFTPVLIDRAERLAEAWRLRSTKRANWRLLAPLGLSVMDDAEQIAEAIRARGGIVKH